MRKILLIEDDVANREGLSRLLRNRRVSTVETGTLKEGLAAHAAGGLDCVVLDLQLPDSDVGETLAAIPRFEPVPVCVYTGVEDPGLIARIKSHGACAVITKGSASDAVIEQIFVSMIPNLEDEGVEEGRELLANRRENYRLGVKKPSWFTMQKITLGLLVTVMVHGVGAAAWFYHTVGDRAVEKKALERTVLTVDQIAPDVSDLKRRAEQTERTLLEAANTLKEVAPTVQQLKEHQIQTDSRMVEDEARLTRNWTEIASLRAELNSGFTRVHEDNSEILKLMIQQQQQQHTFPRK